MNSATMLKTLGWRLILISVMAVLAAARSFVKANSVPGITFDLKVIKQVDDYALLEVTPNGKWVGKAEPAAMILKKTEGKWTTMFMGTDITPWRQMVPDLFE